MPCPCLPSPVSCFPLPSPHPSVTNPPNRTTVDDVPGCLCPRQTTLRPQPRGLRGHDSRDLGTRHQLHRFARDNVPGSLHPSRGHELVDSHGPVSSRAALVG